jgi:hypothetical protein
MSQLGAAPGLRNSPASVRRAGRVLHPNRMSNSSATLTPDRYGHLFPALDGRLVEGLDAVYRSAAAGCHGMPAGRRWCPSLAEQRSRSSGVVGAEGLEPPTASL